MGLPQAAWLPHVALAGISGRRRAAPNPLNQAREEAQPIHPTSPTWRRSRATAWCRPGPASLALDTPLPHLRSHEPSFLQRGREQWRRHAGLRTALKASRAASKQMHPFSHTHDRQTTAERVSTHLAADSFLSRALPSTASSASLPTSTGSPAGRGAWKGGGAAIRRARREGGTLWRACRGRDQICAVASHTPLHVPATHSSLLKPFSKPPHPPPAHRRRCGCAAAPGAPPPQWLPRSPGAEPPTHPHRPRPPAAHAPSAAPGACRLPPLAPPLLRLLRRLLPPPLLLLVLPLLLPRRQQLPALPRASGQPGKRPLERPPLLLPPHQPAPQRQGWAPPGQRRLLPAPAGAARPPATRCAAAAAGARSRVGRGRASLAGGRGRTAPQPLCPPAAGPVACLWGWVREHRCC